VLYSGEAYSSGLLEALRALGYDQKSNLTFDERSAAGSGYRLSQLAAELVSLKPDVLLGSGTPSVLALKRATDSIPIVMFDVGPIVTDDVSNPFASGLIQSMAHTGGNVTGIGNDSYRLFIKVTQIAREAFPDVCCFLWMRNPSNPAHLASEPYYRELTGKLRIEARIVDVATPDQLDHFMGAPLDERFKHVLVVQPDRTFYSRRAEISDYALSRGLALFTPFRAEGALVSYSQDVAEEFSAVASYVDRILRGAKPADLPVQLPTKFLMTINLKTARGLGITVPPSVIGQATELIE
jgi:putative ABC transport system substrate-binding protein